MNNNHYRLEEEESDLVSGRWWAQEDQKATRNVYDLNTSNDNEIEVRKRFGPATRCCCRFNYQAW